MISLVLFYFLSLKKAEHKRFSFFYKYIWYRCQETEKKVLRREESLFSVLMFGAFINVVQEAEFLSAL